MSDWVELTNLTTLIEPNELTIRRTIHLGQLPRGVVLLLCAK